MSIFERDRRRIEWEKDSLVSKYFPQLPAIGKLQEKVNIVLDEHRNILIQEWGGKKHGDRIHRAVSLRCIGDRGSVGEILSATETYWPDASLHYEVRGAIVTYDHPIMLLRNFQYSEQGNLTLMQGRSADRLAIYLAFYASQMTRSEVDDLLNQERKNLIEKGHFVEGELPENIDCEKVVKEFIENIKDGKFTKRVLTK